MKLIVGVVHAEEFVGTVDEALMERLLANPIYADQIIRITYAHPREYYLRKHGIIT